MAEPQNQDEYLVRWTASEKFEGTGDARLYHVPCPFCAAPDFMIYSRDTMDAVRAAGAICKECKRGAQEVTPPGGGAREIVQTAGPAQPAWLEPLMRSVIP